MTWGYVYNGKFVRKEVALKVATVNEEFLLNAKRARQLPDGRIEEMPNFKVKMKTRPISCDFKNAGDIAKRETEKLREKLRA